MQSVTTTTTEKGSHNDASPEQSSNFQQTQNTPKKHSIGDTENAFILQLEKTQDSQQSHDPKNAQNIEPIDTLYEELDSDSGFTKDTFIKLVSKYVEKSDNEEIILLDHFGGTPALENQLNTDLKNGLKSDSLDEENRKALYGSNVLPKRKLSSFLQLCYNAFKDLIMILLFVCGGISLIFGVFFGANPSIDWIEGFAIWVAIIIVTFITAANDMVKERQFDKLARLMDEKKCTILRDGQKLEVSVFSVLVGDVLCIESGDEICADCITILSNDLSFDESSLTGETDHMKKDTIENSILQLESARKQRGRTLQQKSVAFQESLSVSSPIILAGSVAANGSGLAIIVAVGTNTISGSAFQKMSLGVEPTPLQNKLNALTHHIGKFGLGSAVLALILLVGQYWIIYLITEPSARQTSEEIFQEHLEFVIIAITVVVVAVPEGLPLAVTLSLAYSINRMLKDQNFVRRLNACEIMGGADQICSDKTGTLTQNKMSIDSFWNGTYLQYFGDVAELSPPQMGNYQEPFIEGLAINNTAYLQVEEVALPGSGNKKAYIKNGIGSSTEAAMLFYLDRIGRNYQTIRDETFAKSPIIDQKNFTSNRKMMSTTISVNGSNNLYRTHVKGAAEKILSFCDYRIDSQGELKSLSESDKMKVEKHVINSMANQALRCVCLAYKDFDPETTTDWNSFDSETSSYKMERNLVCLGIVGIRDPLRLGVPASIRQCKKAGIKVRMITGDNIETAKQIALMCGIHNPEMGGKAMLGSEFYQLCGGVVCKNCRTEFCDCPLDPKTASQVGKPMRVDVIGNLEAFKEIAATLDVMARSQPRDKYALVTGLKELGSVVAVTGDGNNDAPALKKADVGFAMGITGKDVAKLAADIIILDDNFESIVMAVKWGRGVFENIRRFLSFQLTVNVVAVLFTLITSLTLRQSPLTALQLLWVNLIMDSFASLALATEPPSTELLNHPPHKRNEYLISKNMFAMILSQAIYQITVLLILVFTADLFVPEVEWSFLTEEIRQQYNFSEFSDAAKTIVRSGRRFHVFSSQADYLDVWFNNISPSRHLTVVFNTFVFMQIFNLLNARNPKRKWNLFAGILVNKLWIGIFILIITLQTLIVQFGGIIFSTNLDGLNFVQWLICIAFGAGGIFVHYLMRYFPAKILPEAGQKEVDLLNEPVSIALASRGRFSRENFSNRLSAGMFTPSEARKDFLKRSMTQRLSKRDSLLRSATFNVS